MTRITFDPKTGKSAPEGSTVNPTTGSIVVDTGGAFASSSLGRDTSSGGGGNEVITPEVQKPTEVLQTSSKKLDPFTTKVIAASGGMSTAMGTVLSTGEVITGSIEEQIVSAQKDVRRQEFERSLRSGGDGVTKVTPDQKFTPQGEIRAVKKKPLSLTELVRAVSPIPSSFPLITRTRRGRAFEAGIKKGLKFDPETGEALRSTDPFFAGGALLGTIGGIFVSTEAPLLVGEEVAASRALSAAKTLETLPITTGKRTAEFIKGAAKSLGFGEAASIATQKLIKERTLTKTEKDILSREESQAAISAGFTAERAAVQEKGIAKTLAFETPIVNILPELIPVKSETKEKIATAIRDKEAFREGVREEGKRRGLTESQIKSLLSVAEKERKTRLFSESAGFVASSAAIEQTGRRIFAGRFKQLEKAGVVISEKKTFGTFFKEGLKVFPVLGAEEGAVQEVIQARARGQEIKPLDIGISAGLGAASAGLIGSTILGAGAAGRKGIAKGLETVVSIADPSEFFGDVTADIATAGKRIVTGTVTPQPTILQPSPDKKTGVKVTTSVPTPIKLTEIKAKSPIPTPIKPPKVSIPTLEPSISPLIGTRTTRGFSSPIPTPTPLPVFDGITPIVPTPTPIPQPTPTPIPVTPVIPTPTIVPTPLPISTPTNIPTFVGIPTTTPVVTAGNGILPPFPFGLGGGGIGSGRKVKRKKFVDELRESQILFSRLVSGGLKRKSKDISITPSKKDMKGFKPPTFNYLFGDLVPNNKKVSKKKKSKGKMFNPLMDNFPLLF